MRQKSPESRLEAAERRYRDALNRGADHTLVLSLVADYVFELENALHGSAVAA